MEIRQELFRQIVTLDYARILSRLRSRHAERTRKTAGKPGLFALLSRTINDPSINPPGEKIKAEAAKARSHSKRMSETFDKFEATIDDDVAPSLSQDVLIDFLIQAYEFDTRSLQRVLQTSLSIDHNLKTFLPQAVSKLGRYYCIACDLIDAARSSRYTLFRRISIEALEEPGFDTASIKDDLVSFDESLQRVTRSSNQRYHESYLSGYLSSARTKFQSRIFNCATPWKIHAEVQLLFFYEQSPDKSRPRIICSSKSACYLCDLFIKIHGKFHIPRTHGRLYDKWILPAWPINESPFNKYTLSVIKRFNAALEAKILHTLNHKRLPCRHPNESVLPLREPWSSTSTLSRAYIRHSTADASDRTYDDVFKDQEEPPSTSSAFVDTNSSEIASKGNLLTIPMPCSKLNTPTVQHRSEERHASMRPSTLITASQRLSRGEWTYYKLTHHCDTFNVETGVVNLHASWDFNIVKATHDACWVQVNWLACRTPDSRDNGRLRSIDINTLKSDRDTIVDGGVAFGSTELCLKKGEHIFLIKYTFEDPCHV